MRRLARSTTNQSQTFRFLRPTNVHISSNSRASHRFFCAFLGRKRGSGGAGRTAFFYPLGNGHACYASYPRNATLRIALQQQGIDLRVLGGFANGSWHEQPLVAAGFALVFRLPLLATIAAKLVAATFCTIMNCCDHQPYTGNTL